MVLHVLFLKYAEPGLRRLIGWHSLVLQFLTKIDRLVAVTKRLGQRLPSSVTN